jgi:hypothetical protein
MTLSMYQASVPAFIRTLSNLKSILEKAAAHAAQLPSNAAMACRNRSGIATDRRSTGSAHT